MTSAAVNSHNGWDPLEEVIVGTAAGAAFPAWEPALNPYFPDPRVGRFFRRSRPRSAQEIDAAEAQLDGLATALEKEGAVVRRPDHLNFTRPIETPTFTALAQNSVACPRDVLLVIGDEIIEAPMAMRARFFEYLPYRRLIKEYFETGARWSAAPKPAMSDDLYVTDFSAREGGFDADTRPSLTEFEPCFDAASFARLGRDIFYQPDTVTNDFGARWLARHLGPEYRLHRVRFADPAPQHIDATMVPLRPGLVMMNPDRPALNGAAELFAANGWEVVPAPRPAPGTGAGQDAVSSWISMNVFNISADRIVCEERQQPLIRFLESVGFTVIALPFTDVYSFGGSFHCCTLDVRRRGNLQSYFPALDDAS